MNAEQLDEVVSTLLGAPVPIETAVLRPEHGGVPDMPGLYAWWSEEGCIPGCPAQPHPDETGWCLLYVGIAPARPSSKQTLRSRVVGNHLGGNTGSSTFRLSLAALLLHELGLHPVSRKKKVVLPAAENRALSDWQRAHLRLTWAEQPEPWSAEAAVLQRLLPPLNLVDNRSHTFSRAMAEARSAFRLAAASEEVL